MKTIKDVFNQERKMLIGFMNDNKKSNEELLIIKHMAYELYCIETNLDAQTLEPMFTVKERNELLSCIKLVEQKVYGFEKGARI